MKIPAIIAAHFPPKIAPLSIPERMA
jgi:hypothetical protein